MLNAVPSNSVSVSPFLKPLCLFTRPLARPFKNLLSSELSLYKWNRLFRHSQADSADYSLHKARGGKLTSAAQGSIAVATVWLGADRGVGKESWELRPLALACS